VSSLLYLLMVHCMLVWLEDLDACFIQGWP
jgi:hypothetical protein